MLAVSRKILAVFILLTTLSPSANAYRLSEPFDHSLFNSYLQKVVNSKGEINIERAQQNQSMLDEYLGHFSSKEFLEGDFYKHWPREERLAALLNLYHAGLIKQILNYYPISTVNEVPGFWDMGVVWLGTKSSLSLNEIRGVKLMENFRDEKIHTVLACGAVSCPGFPQRAFSGPEVEGQLYVAARGFVNSEAFVQILPDKKRVLLSRIFKWYASDFQLDFGFTDEAEIFTPGENAVLSFVAYYLDDVEKIQFLEERRYKIKYLPFDWKLNVWQDGAGTPDTDAA